MSRYTLIFLLPLLTVTSSALAQIRDLTILQERRAHLNQRSDSLMSVRIRLVSRRDSLSQQAESLWSQDPESTQLLRVRSASRLLIAHLQVIEKQLDSLSTEGDSLDADLRDCYDWEIGQLHGLLTEEGWDEGLYRQLLVFQDEREALGTAIRASHYRFDGDHELSISAEDGPEELRQKIEYAQDRVAALQEEQREIARQCRQIDRKVMTMQKFWHLAEEMIRLHGTETEMTRMRVVDGPEGPGAEIVRPGAELPRTRGARSRAPARGDSATTPIEAPWLLKGQQLRARAQQLRDVEAVFQERIGVFHEHLSRILEGGE